jgi:hypothetical protein
MAPARSAKEDFARSRYLETLRHCLSGFDAFGTPHKDSLSLESREIGLCKKTRSYRPAHREAAGKKKRGPANRASNTFKNEV